MADVMTGVERSALMAKIRGRGNRSTELSLLLRLRSAKLTGWRRHAGVPGRPDFVFRREKVAIFVDGCFWHGCPRHFQAPATRAEFWREKIRGNVRRDRRVRRRLRENGWLVVRVWEHELRAGGGDSAIRRIIRAVSARRAVLAQPQVLGR